MQKDPEVPSSTQPEVPKSNVARSTQKYPKVTKSNQKYP